MFETGGSREIAGSAIEEEDQQRWSRLDDFRRGAVVESAAPVSAAGRRPHGLKVANGQSVRESRVQQQSFAVFVHADEHDVTLQAAVRKMAFLGSELRRIPSWHPMHHEYEQQLRALRRRLDPGPQGVLD